MAVLIIIIILVIIILAIKLNSLKKRHNDFVKGHETLQKSNESLQDELKNLQESNEILQDELKKKKNTLESYKNAEKTIDKFTADIKQLKKEISLTNAELENIRKDIVAENIVICDYDDLNSEECKNELALLKSEATEYVKSDKAFLIGNTTATKKQINDNKKQILRCFTAECSMVIDGLTFKNADTARGKITRSFENINKLFASDGVHLDKMMLEFALKELTIVYAVILKKEQEKEEQKAIKAQMLEEEKVHREIEREKLKIEKEETQFKNEITKLMNYLQKASDVEKQLYVDKIKELEEKLKLLEKDKENIFQREQNTRAGFVYVISNIGSFGDDVYKIGMTRRLEPMDRVKELGDASVPFEFDVHAMIFSEDAPALETILHNTFRGKEVNKVNLRKEFFKVSLEEIEKVVKENHNATIHFTKIAEALQYRETLKIEEQSKTNF